MATFETILLLLAGSAFLSMLVKSVAVPYPTLLALGGVALAFIPGIPVIRCRPT